MCGIAGILALGETSEAREAILKRMLAAQRHRGPDESGIYVDPQVGLGSVRLSIIGIDGGCQPIANEDGSLWIVYNGEVFNYIELRAELERKGHRFATRTDTEVLLHLYEEYGPGGLGRLNGQFALAVWSTRRQELFLARDRVGIRPLHYYRDPQRFVFASEVKAVFQHPQVPRELDPEALNQVFTLWATVAPRTAFREIQELPPGHCMHVSAGGLQIERYWSLPAHRPAAPSKGTFEDAADELRALLKDAVHLRLRADVPVGAYLSGGLDSTLITTLVARHFDNRLKTFSIGFEDRCFDETAFQDEAVGRLGTEHYRSFTRSADIRTHFADVVWHCEKPLLRTAPVPLYLLSRAVRDHRFKVVLTGEGADEVFGGYNIFKEAKVRRFWAQRPDSRLRPLLLERLYPYVFKDPARTRAFLQKFYGVTSADLADPLLSHRVRWRNSGRNCAFFSDELKRSLNGAAPAEAAEARLTAEFFEADPLSRAQILEMELFMSNYLLSSQGDRVAMANSLEIRMPFLDYRVVEFGLQLPPQWKINGLLEKYLLRRAFEDELPPGILNRPKQPYRAPIRDAFLQTTKADYVDDLLSESAVRKVGLFDPGRTAGLVKKIRTADAAAPGETQEMAFLGILSTQILHRQFVEDFHGRDVQPIIPDKIVRVES